ncbi:hypothetical protein [Bartonella sp. TT29SHDZB]|uniref:hypothetical protein n=1 Tax=Bartonella sp. TT29SHDZB TaxID=3243581 RepID=UPI0035CFA9A3
MINNPLSLPSLGMARLFPHAHYLTDEEKQHLQEGVDGITVHLVLTNFIQREQGTKNENVV